MIKKEIKKDQSVTVNRSGIEQTMAFSQKKLRRGCPDRKSARLKMSEPLVWIQLINDKGSI